MYCKHCGELKLNHIRLAYWLVGSNLIALSIYSLGAAAALWFTR